MNVQLYTGVTGWIKPNTERIVSKQLYASARRVQWKHTPQLELSLYIRVLFFFLMMKREYRHVSMRNTARGTLHRRRINSSHSHFCNLKRNERQFSPEQFYGVNYFRWKRLLFMALRRYWFARYVFLSYFDPILRDEENWTKIKRAPK